MYNKGLKALRRHKVLKHDIIEHLLYVRSVVLAKFCNVCVCLRAAPADGTTANLQQK